MKKLNFSKISQIATSVWVAVIMVVLISISAYYTNKQLVRQAEVVEESHEQLFRLEHFFSAVKDAEIGSRGYMLTDKEVFLEPYLRSEQNARQSYEKLLETGSGHPERQKNLKELGRLMKHRFEILNRNLGIYNAGTGTIDTSFISNLLEGKQVMDSLGIVVDHMKEEELRMLNEKKIISVEAAQLSQLFIVIAAALYVVILIFAYVALKNEYKNKIESESRFRTIFDQSADTIFLSDHELKIIDINRAGAELSGYEISELQNKKLTDIISGNISETKLNALIKGDEEIIELKTELIHKAGKKINVLLSFKKQKADDKQLQGVITDITQRLIEEKNKRQTDRFVTTGRIARIIAHEIRNPLTNINLSVQQALETTPEEKEMLASYFDIIERNSMRINQLVTQLLESTKFSDLIKQEYPIVKLIDEAIEIAKDRMALNGTQLIKEYNRSGDCAIHVDVEKMKIALVNIIINAIEAMQKEKGVLTIDSYTKSDHCIVTITDNGHGISAENLAKLFEPFYTGKARGTGLGLTSAQTIIYNHGGSIEVKSNLNEGTTFIITLPSSREET